MNVNLTPVPESAKSPKATTDSVDATESGASEGGFFSKLAAMLLGDSESKGRAKSETEPQVTNRELKAASDGQAVAANSADSLLEQDVSTASDSEPALEPNTEAAAKAESTDTKSLSDTAHNSGDSEPDVNATMQQGDELLTRLNQSNQALKVTSADGKELPPEKGAVKAESMPATENMPSGASGNNVATNDSSVESEEVLASLPASAQRFIEHPSDAKPNESQLDTPQASKGSSNEAATEAAMMSGAKADSSDVAVLNQTAQAPDSDSKEESEQAVIASSQAVTATAQGLSASTQESDKADQEPKAAPAIAWGKNLTVKAHGESAPQADKPVPSPAQQSASASTQALPFASQAAEKAAVTASIPADLSQAQQLLAAQQLNSHSVPTRQAVLQAALGAKALSGLNDKSDSGKEANLAQQIASAAGGQNSNTLAQTRTEGAQQAQPPLQLSREMASDQVAERVQMMMSKNLKNVDIRLDPPELGRMQIRMNMNGDQATVHFTVNNHQARDVIEQSMPRLREMLAQQGVQLSDTSVQQQNSGQQQSRYAAGENGGSGQGNSSQDFGGEENLEPDTKLDLNVALKRDGISYYA